MDFKFRFARPGDKKLAAELIVQAMDDLALKLVNTSSISEAIPVFEFFFELSDNVYSYENAIVCEDADGVVGVIIGYDGGKFNALRQPFIDFVKINCGFNADIEDETSAGEFYLDTVSVFPEKQRLGIGTALVNTMINHARELGHLKVGLLVDKLNPEAKKLYHQIGFGLPEEKVFLGGAYEHLTFDLLK
jgi:ribosomal protein S18 acetylase RimI-like enzyme